MEQVPPPGPSNKIFRTPNPFAGDRDDAPEPMRNPTISEHERMFLMRRREALMLELNAIEDYLELERSLIPRRKRCAPANKT